MLYQQSGNDFEPFVTNLMGLVRFMIQSENMMTKVGYEVMYIALIVYTIKFTIVYLKRVLNMAFLTLIAPIVALTYPIDKLNDGTAQGFNMWLKEYIFNALLQPMHYIMYYILLGSAISLAAKNPLYGIVVLLFMTEAEKLLKKIFGFDKANGGTVGGMTGAFAAGAIASNIKNIAKFAKGGPPGKGGKAVPDGTGASNNLKPIKNDTGLDTFLSDGAENVAAGMTGAAAGAAIGTEQSLENSPNNVPELDEGDTNSGGSTIDGTDTNSEGSAIASTDGADEPDENNQATGTINPNSNNIDNGESIRNKAQRIGKGTKAVGRRLAKPIWDFDKSGKYNRRRLVRKIGRGALGVGVGIGAAAVQAGISITDGKYNPMEGIATFTAGYAGGGQIAKGIGGLADTYREGADAGDKNAIMKRAQASFGDRDDVIAFNKKNYQGREKEAMERQRDNYLARGVTDLKDMKKCMKYADSRIKNNYDNFDSLSKVEQSRIREKEDRRAAATLDFKNTLQEEGMLSAVNDVKKQESYIQAKVNRVSEGDRARERAIYEAAFRAVAEFNDTQK